MHGARCRPVTIAIECCPAVSLYPAVEQSIAGPGVESDHRRVVRSEYRDVGDAADIQNDALVACHRTATREMAEPAARPGRPPQYPRCGSRRPWLSRSRRDGRRIANLQGVRRDSIGLVADCLTVTAYGANIVCCDAALVQQFQGGITETLADLRSSRPEFSIGWSTRCRDCVQQRAAKCVGVRLLVRCTMLTLFASKLTSTASMPSMLVPDIRPM